MKKFGITLLVLTLFGFGLSPEKISDEDRTKAVDHLTQTRDNLLNTVAGLSDAQLNYKTSPESWSVAECVEHIAISENLIFDMMNSSLQDMADMANPMESTVSDDDLLAMITDRSHKVKTSEPFEPSGKFGSYEETLEEFVNKRNEHIDYLNTTEDELRSHYAKLPFGTVDAYQVVLFMSGHTERHTKQIEEVMADPGFPEE